MSWSGVVLMLSDEWLKCRRDVGLVKVMGIDDEVVGACENVALANSRVVCGEMVLVMGEV